MSEKGKERAQEILLAPNVIEYMSSEESDSGATENDSSRGPKPRKIRKLGWERTKLRNLKAWIDESHNESLSDRQRRTSAHVRRTRSEISQFINSLVLLIVIVAWNYTCSKIRWKKN